MPQLALGCCASFDAVEQTEPVSMARAGIQVEAELDPTVDHGRATTTSSYRIKLNYWPAQRDQDFALK